MGEIIGRPLEFYHGLRGREQEARVMETLEDIELDDTFYDRFPRSSQVVRNNASVLHGRWPLTLKLCSAMRLHQPWTRSSRRGF